MAHSLVPQQASRDGIVIADWQYQAISKSTLVYKITDTRTILDTANLSGNLSIPVREVILTELTMLPMLTYTTA
jgi:hypothetical protein